MLHTNEWGIAFAEQVYGLSMKASTTRSIWCLGGAVSWLSRMLAVAGYNALSEAEEEVLVFRRQVQNFMEPSMRILHIHHRVRPST